MPFATDDEKAVHAHCAFQVLSDQKSSLSMSDIAACRLHKNLGLVRPRIHILTQFRDILVQSR